MMLDLNTEWYARNFCAHIQEGEGFIVPGTERHARLFEVRTCTYT